MTNKTTAIARLIFLLAFISLSLVAGPAYCEAPVTKTASVVEVDAARVSGDIPGVLRCGAALTFEFPEGEVMKRFFGGLKPGPVEMPVLRSGFPDSLEEYKRLLPGLSATRWAVQTRKSGGTPVIAFKDVPVWLQKERGREGAHVVPPEDLEGWARYVEATVDFYNNRLGLDADYVLWDEPDIEMYWNGTEADYLRLYRYTVLGALRADRRAKVGGPAASSWEARAKGSEGGRTLIENFIRYASKTGIRELGIERLPVSFLTWHQFDTNPSGDPLQYSTPAERLRSLLKEAGYASTRLSLSSWNTWVGFGRDANELSPERDTEFSSAYVIHALNWMERAGIDEQVFFSLTEKWQWDALSPERKMREFKDGEFFGGFGLFTRNGFIKPVFNSFAALAMLSGKRVFSASNDPYISVISSKDRGRLYVIVSNFHWPEEKPKDFKLRILAMKGYTFKDLSSLGLGEEEWKAVEEGDAGKIRSFAVPEKVKADFLSLSALDGIYKTRRGLKDVELRIGGLDTAGARFERYEISSARSNSFKARRSVEDAVINARKKLVFGIAERLVRAGRMEERVLGMEEERKIEEVLKALEQAPEEEKRRVEDEAKAAEEAVASSVNSMGGVGLEKVEEGVLKGGPLKFSMEPYTVELFIISAAGGKGR